MTTTREYFRKEAREILARLEETVGGSSAGSVDAEGLRMHGRALRGSAQLAREERVRDLAHALEVAGRTVGSGLLSWSSELKDCALDTLGEIRRLMDADAGDPASDARVAELLDRWRALGIEPPVRAVRAAAPAAESAAAPTVGGSAPDAAAPKDFRRFVATELAGILSTLEAAIPALARDGRNREPLKAILRRQRALFGAAQLDRVPPVAETLNTIDQITRLIARLDAAVTGYWLDVYRSARDVLAAVVGPLDRGEDSPVPEAALQRLRTLRDRLLEREASAAASSPAVARADELPVEVINFFRTEAEALLNRIERLIGQGTEQAGGQPGRPRSDVRDAFTALRDIARTFGFNRTAELVDRALEDIAERGGAGVPALLAELRVTVVRELPGEAAPAAPSWPPSEQAAAGAAATGAATVVDATSPVDDSTTVPQPESGPSPEEAGPEAVPAAPEIADPVGPAGELPGDAAPAGAVHAPEPAADDVVDIETLLYRGESALRRALELRPELERALTDPSARDVLDEVFDLIRLGMS